MPRGTVTDDDTFGLADSAVERQRNGRRAQAGQGNADGAGTGDDANSDENKAEISQHPTSVVVPPLTRPGRGTMRHAPHQHTPALWSRRDWLKELRASRAS